jgi:hypothetical protein
MVAIGTALVFALSFALAVGTIAFMFVAYRDKMIAALLYRPEPAPRPVYAVAIQRKRQNMAAVRTPMPAVLAA